MKYPISFPGTVRGNRPMTNAGFTLPEILVATAVFVLVLLGIVSTNLFGLKMFQITNTKLNAITWSRETSDQLIAQVRACNSVWVGNVDTNGVFKTLLDGETQQGTGLLIYPTTNTTNYIIYFVNPSDQTFRRTTAQPGTAEILADSVTNTMVFSAQDFSGNVLTNNDNNRVIHLTLEFYQPSRYMLGADYYKMETSMTRRALQ